MLVYQSGAFIACLVCLTSAFSTQFVIEGMDQGEKPKAEKEIKSKIPEKINGLEKSQVTEGMEVEVIPIATDVFTQTDDFLNMTPLKLATAISAQYLLTMLDNIPIAGNSYEDAMNMFEGIVKEFNKTTQIIKLTAEYVNISSHYILSTLNRFDKSSCERKLMEESIHSVRKNFYETVSRHIKNAVKELNQKSQNREMTGGDVLVSSAYHIVSAFQEMTNQVLTLSSESSQKCNPPPSLEVSPNEEKGASEKKFSDVYNIQVVPQQGMPHKSIKKDQAKPPMSESKIMFVDLGKTQNNQMKGIENLKINQDLTIEVFSPQEFLKENKEVILNKVNDKKVGNNEDLTVEVFSPQDFLKKIKKGVLNKVNDKKVSNNEDLTVEVFSPESVFKKNQKEAVLDIGSNKLKLPNDLNENDAVSFLFGNPKNVDYKLRKDINDDSSKETITEKYFDKELASSAVDSLSNIPWMSSESEVKGLEKDFKFSTQDKKQLSPFNSNRLNVLELFPADHNPVKSEQDLCSEDVEPVCGIDKINQKFIIFLNDCKRKAHNKKYGTDFNWFNMDVCVGLFMRNPALRNSFASATKSENVNLRPR